MSDTGRWDPKDPNEVKDYVFDWTELLSGDTISTSDWSVAVGQGLTINSESNTDTATTVWLSGGVAGVTYQLLNRITTAGGRTYDRTRKLKCKNL